MMWHSGQIAETMSISSDSSTSHPLLPALGWQRAGRAFWFTIEKQPVPQAGRPADDR